MRSYPLEEITSLISADELRDWMEYPCFTTAQTAAANGLLKAACQAVSDHMQREIGARKRRLEIEEWPAHGTRSHGLRPQYQELERPLPLPFGPVISIESVTADGETVDPTDYDLELDALDMEPQNDVVIEYTAGYTNTPWTLPETVRLAILTLATYLWHKRGESAVNALRESGAEAMLIPYRDLTP